MGIQIDHLYKKPIVILKTVHPISIPDDARSILYTLDQFNMTVDGPTIQIFDMTDVDLLVSDMVITTAAQSIEPYRESDPAVTTIFVGNHAAIAFAKEYMTAETYLFPSLDEAIDFARSLV